jgi:uncharacterized protein (DUF983 family)
MDAMTNEDQAHWPPIDPVSAGLRGRCPRCGEGRLFAGYLSLKPRCGICDLDNAFADSGDGPAVFVVLIVGFIVVGLALWAEVSFAPPLWLLLILFIPLAILLCMVSLRWAKGILIALQYRNRAAEGQIDR